MNPYKLYKQYKLSKLISHRKCGIAFKIMLPVMGFLALVWFLIRVIPKPSRAAYPCQRIAFPLASGFILWLTGVLGAISFLKKARWSFGKKQVLTGLGFFAAAVLILSMALTFIHQRKVFGLNPIPNQPLGIAKGIHPGRVVWVHDPNATDWNGVGDGYSWQPEHTSQKHVDAMVSRAVRELTGQEFDAQAWNALFIHFNDSRGKGPVGYTPGEKITIKVNLSTCNVRLGTVNPATYEKTSYLTKSDTSPQVIIGVLRQLVYEAGVNPVDIAVGDTLTYFPNQWWDLCHAEFPQVTYFDEIGQQGRVQSLPSTVRQHWSHGLDPNAFLPDYIPLLYAEADYLINIAVLKGHAAGITLCGKNHYGSYNRTPDAAGYYDLHDSLAGFNTADGQYRGLVDILGHPEMGGKTLLSMIDGLYGGYYWQGTAYKFLMTPFDNDWPSSIFVSQDSVAIDSVGLDILWQEWPNVVQIGGVEDYLREAAQADNPPSGTFYDPDGDGIAVESLGVYERWNNVVDKQYSRNLGTGNGIELRYIRLTDYPGDFNHDEHVDLFDLTELANAWLWVGQPGLMPEDVVEDGTVNYEDFNILSQNWEAVD